MIECKIRLNLLLLCAIAFKHVLAIMMNKAEQIWRLWFIPSFIISLTLNPLDLIILIRSSGSYSIYPVWYLEDGGIPDYLGCRVVDCLGGNLRVPYTKI
jgi:hypothetical protein